jgi:small GTP-binding protein
MKGIKCVVAGDGSVGKTCMLITYTSGKCPEEYIPTVFDNYSLNIMPNGKPINLGLWDTGYRSDEGFHQLFPLSLPQTDVVLLCFSIVSQPSYQNMSTRYLPILLKHIPEVPIIIVGTKLDLRDDQETLEKLKNKKTELLTSEQGEEAVRLFRKDGANISKYMECSSVTNVGVKELFEAAALVGWYFQEGEPNPSDKKKGKCIMM